MLPIYGFNEGYFEGGGIIGSSPLYGEHSLVLTMLFAVLIMDRSLIISKRILLAGMVISYLNIFMSISRSVFLLSVFGLMFNNFLQYKINKVNVQN
ncbi:MAG: hypothetical protein IPJ23_05920 [Ignavibacteriales bacterium]|nr:hypothetical protein [Ignavibacteriales bacterium]